MRILLAVILAFPIPVPAHNYIPPCSVEDGNGVAVCLWEGVVSGDCAPDYLGSVLASRVCLAKHKTKAEEMQICGERNFPESEKCIKQA